MGSGTHMAESTLFRCVGGFSWLQTNASGISLENWREIGCLTRLRKVFGGPSSSAAREFGSPNHRLPADAFSKLDNSLSVVISVVTPGR